MASAGTSRRWNQGCRYDPAKRAGEDACPFSTLYWDFLDRNKATLAGVRRMQMPYRTLEKMDEGELKEIRRRSEELREHLDA